MTFSGSLSQYEWHIVNVQGLIGDASLYVLRKAKGWFD